MIILNEAGLLEGDLDYLILPLIEIDTFESKISNSKAIVIAFYVFEQDPAKDLERFIEKDPVAVLDTETSPAPTEDGYYVVFVELDRDNNFPELTRKIVESISNLTNVKKWQFKTLNDDTIYDLSEETLSEHINLDPALVPKSEDDVKDELDQEDEKKSKKSEKESKPEEDIAETVSLILSNGLMESIEIYGDQLQLSGYKSSLKYRVSDVSVNEPSVPILGLEIGNPLINECKQLSYVLGPAYIVETIDNGLLVTSEHGYLILELLD